ncbi:MAG: cytochrome b5 domain-containing protein [Clostridium sp.]
MTIKNVLKEKFEDIEILKTLMSEYPSEYRQNIIDKIEEKSDEVSEYLESLKRVSQEFSLEELAKYNGKDGMPAYVAVNGTVYDVTKVKPWRGGSHFGVMAGGNLTKEFAQCHSIEGWILKELTPVGILKD